MPNHHTYRFDRDTRHGSRGHRHGGPHRHHHRSPGFFPVAPYAGAPWWIWPVILNNRRCC